MKPCRRITVADVKASFNKNVRDHFTVRWFGRPFADAITPYFYNNGWTANGVTLFRVVVCFIGLACFLLPYDWGPALAALVFYNGFIMDCVDGNLSRLQNSATFFGKFVDGLADMLYVGLAPLMAGLGIWINTGEGVYLLCGALTSCCAIMMQAVRSRVMFFEEWMVAQSGPITEETEKKLATARKYIRWITLCRTSLTFFVPAILFVPGSVKLYVLLLVGLQFPLELAWCGSLVLLGSGMLRRGRRSVHAAIAEDAAADGARPPERPVAAG